MSSKRPRIILVNRCILLDDAGKLLMIQRAKDDRHLPGSWECPGGKLDAGQDLLHAFEREVMEETGLLAEPTSRMAYVDSYVVGDNSSHKMYKGLPYVAIFSIGKSVGGKLKLSHEHDDYKWCTYDEAMDLKLTPEVQKALIVLKDSIDK
jgi:8-oxo-dGTP diphosphatase